MRVSEVLKRSGVTRKALRVYEARGIVSPARRTTSGYRIYADDVLGLLAFVQQGQRLGLSLAEIHRIIDLRRSGAPPCAHVRQLLERRACDLKALLAEVDRILETWPLIDGRPAAICAHIKARGGDGRWKDTRCVQDAPTARRSSLKATRSASVRIRTPPSSKGRSGTSSLN